MLENRGIASETLATDRMIKLTSMCAIAEAAAKPHHTRNPMSIQASQNEQHNRCALCCSVAPPAIF